MNEEQKRKLHVKLIKNLVCDHLDEKAFKGEYRLKFQMNAREYLTTPVQKSKEDARDIIDELERLGKVGPGNYEVLKELVEDIDPKMLELIEDTERLMQINGNNRRNGPIAQPSESMERL